MMRKNKFRGKYKNWAKDIWVYGNLCTWLNKAFIFENDIHRFNIVRPETVGQCTNLKDYGGTYEVYEDDIVQDLDDATLGLVYWDEEEAGFMIEFDSVVVPAKDMSCYQVVGNRWDNPELFKEWERQKEDI